MFTFFGSEGAYVSRYVSPRTHPRRDVSAASTLEQISIQSQKYRTPGRTPEPLACSRVNAEVDEP